MYGIAAYICLPELAKCWYNPLVLNGFEVWQRVDSRSAWMPLSCYAARPVSDTSPDPELEYWVRAGGICANLGMTLDFLPGGIGEAYLSRFTCPRTLEDIGGARAPTSDLDETLARSAQARLYLYIGRTLVASGARPMGGCPAACCRSAFHADPRTLEAATGRLAQLGAEVRRVSPPTSLAQAHRAGHAIDLYAVVTHGRDEIEVFSGLGINPRTGNTVQYAAVNCAYWARHHRQSARLAGACETFLVAEGARLVNGTRGCPKVGPYPIGIE
jgi:hypothetical protein